MAEIPILIEPTLWWLAWDGLRNRGQGWHETACVWAGHRSGQEERVVEIIFLDDLPGVESFELQHRTSRTATEILFEMLRQKQLSIIADVHTHPEDWVDLSRVDQAHPIEYRPGLTALVLPYYASREPSINATGVHIYCGKGRWRRLTKRMAEKKVQIR